MSIAAIAAIAPPPGIVTTLPAQATMPSPMSFAKLIQNGLDSVNAKAGTAEAAVRAFALDDSVPVHQVSYALEQARMSLELMLQVRGRLVEGYQQLMNMQL